MKVTLQSHNIFAAARHIQLLGQIFGKDVPNPYSTFEILIKAEREAHRKACQYCNGEIDGETYERWEEKFVQRLAGKLGVKQMPEGFFVNGDPRGYSLKMKEGTFPQGFWIDFGGYGILAPEF